MIDRRSQITTKRLYETDSYIREFTAVVTGFEEVENDDNQKADNKKGLRVVLDKTAFFPEGGGQSFDTGFINDLPVYNVQIEDGVLVHYVRGDISAFAEGDSVSCRIDYEKRFRRMQKHTGEHILCGIIHNMTGYDNVGFHLADDYVTLDVNGPLSEEQLEEAERQANQVVYKNVPVNVIFPSPEQLKDMDYRSKLEIMDNVRIVEIEGYDMCACCAPHVSHTGEVGLIKITDAIPHRGGMRITMSAGAEAYEDYCKLQDNTKRIMAMLSAKRYETGDALEKSQKKAKVLQEENIALKKEITAMTFARIKSELENRAERDNSPLVIISSSLDDVQLRNVINECTEIFDGIVAGFIGNDEQGYRYIISIKNEKEEKQLPKLAKVLNEALEGRGGGNSQMIQGSVKADSSKINDFMKKL